MAFTRQTLNAVIQIKDKSRALRIYGSVVGFDRRYLEYEPTPRRPHPRPKGVGEGIGRGLSLIVTNSIQPLRLVTYLGLLASLFNVVYIGYVFLIWIFKEDRSEGWVTTSLQSSTMFFLLFIILTVLSEYVGRLFAEMLDRPTYFVAEERISSVMISDEGRRNVVEQSQVNDLGPEYHLRHPEWQVPAFRHAELAPKSGDACVCIPVINEGERIRAQLERMRSAKLSVDVLIADGGSTDGSLAPELLRETSVRTLLTKTGPRTLERADAHGHGLRRRARLHGPGLRRRQTTRTTQRPFRASLPRSRAAPTTCRARATSRVGTPRTPRSAAIWASSCCTPR